MKKTRIHTLAFLLAGALALTAAGCGSSGTDGTDTSSSVTKEKTAENKKASSESGTSDTSSYAGKLFDTSLVHEINIEISDEDWADLKENPLAKTKYKTNITIDGETMNSVSFATKGNTSLSSVASDKDSDRYSFKLNFGKYVDDQTYYGLKKLNLNNLYADATYMKDYLSYQIFRTIGAEAPLTSYVHLSINGESFGLYLAVEEVDESFLSRNGEDGALYKPETEMLDNMDKIGGGKMPEGMQMPEGMTPPDGMQMPEGMTPPDGMQMPEGMTPPDGMQMPEGMTPPDGMQMPEGMTPPDSTGTSDSGSENNGDSKKGNGKGGGPDGFGGFGGSSNGASLAYTDDKIESYSDIFDNAETDVTEEDEKRVISALKQLSEGSDLKSCLDTDAVIRYFVAHNFVLNYDSYTGNMLHNYYLYEEDGKLSMIPWDYNLAFGGFGGGGGAGQKPGQDADNADAKNRESDATSLVNTGIDTPLSGTTADARPMWAWIAGNEEYLTKYHEIYDELLKNYFENGTFAAEIDRVTSMIKPYIEKDSSAFYTAEEFTKASETLKSFCLLRAESIRKQLDGALPTSTTEQKKEDQVDASGITIKDMGSQGGGKDFGGGREGGKDFGGDRKKPDRSNTEQSSSEEP